jgi:dipeptidyl aminopeptidase/acylaminoacyl peptidase
MPDVKELYEDITRQAPPQRDPLGRQHGRQRRAVRNRKIGAMAVAAILILGLAWIVRPGAPSQVPAVTPTPPPLPTLAGGSYLLDVETGEVEAAGHVEGGFAWAPSPTDPLREAFNKEDEDGLRQVWVTSVDELRRLTDLPDASAPVWSPDGRWVAFATGWTRQRSAPQVYVAEVDSGVVSQLTDEPLGADAPTWSPDGTSIIYGASRLGQEVEGLPILPQYSTLREVDLLIDGNVIRAGRTTEVIGDQADPADMPSWASSGDVVAYVRTASPTSRLPDADASLWLLDLRSGRTEQLVPDRPGLADPRFSPDDERISFKVEGPDGWEAWVVDVATGEARRLSQGYPFTWADATHVHIDVIAPEQA